MENLRAKMKAHPILASIATIFVYMIGTRLISLFFRLLPVTPVTDTLYELVGVGWTFALVAASGYAWAYKERGLFKTLRMTLPHLLIFGIFTVFSIVEQVCAPQSPWLPMGNIIYGVVALFAIGFNEESIFRGIVVNLLGEKGMNTRRDVMKVVLTSGLLFGLAHMSNAMHGVDLSSAIFQSIGAIAGGILFTTYYLRGGSLWGVMLIHMVQDSAGLFESLFILGDGGTSALNAISSSVLFTASIFLLVSLFMLRKSKCKEIIARYARRSGEA